MIHLDISEIYTHTSISLNKLASSIMAMDVMCGVSVRPIITKHEYRNNHKHKRPTMFGLDEDFFYIDTFIENLFVDVLSDYMYWCGGVKSKEASEYLLSSFTIGSLNDNQYIVLKNIFNENRFFDVVFCDIINKLLLKSEETLSLDKESRTWEIITATVSSRSVTIEHLGDWRVTEYMRLLESGILEPEYTNNSRLSNIHKSAGREFTKYIQPKVTKDISLAIATKYSALRENISQQKNQTEIKKLVQLGFLIKGKGGVYSVNDEILMNFVRDTVLNEELSDPHPDVDLVNPDLLINNPTVPFKNDIPWD